MECVVLLRRTPDETEIFMERTLFPLSGHTVVPSASAEISLCDDVPRWLLLRPDLLTRPVLRFTLVHFWCEMFSLAKRRLQCLLWASVFRASSDIQAEKVGHTSIYWSEKRNKSSIRQTNRQRLLELWGLHTHTSLGADAISLTPQKLPQKMIHWTNEGISPPACRRPVLAPPTSQFTKVFRCCPS